MMKKILGLLMAMLVFMAPVLAQDEGDAGITPDSIFWGIDVALDRLAFALTTDNAEKVLKGLEIAEERLLEIKVMAEEKKFEAMVKAESEHGKVVFEVKKAIDDIEDDDPLEEVKKVIELEKSISEHESSVEGVRQKIEIEIRGEITEDQQALIDSLLASLEGQTGELKIKIINKKDKTKIKIKLKTGLSDIEIEQEVGKLEREIGGFKEKLKVKAEILGNKTQVKVELEFDSDILDEDDLIAELIERFSLDRATVDSLLEIEEENESEAREDRLRIKAEIEEDESEVEVELRFSLDSTDRDDIIDAIVARTLLTEADVLDVIELKVEDEDECSEDSDCKADEFCDNGECEDLDEEEEEEEEDECTEDSDCDEDETCVDGECKD